VGDSDGFFLLSLFQHLCDIMPPASAQSERMLLSNYSRQSQVYASSGTTTKVFAKTSLAAKRQQGLPALGKAYTGASVGSSESKKSDDDGADTDSRTLGETGRDRFSGSTCPKPSTGELGLDRFFASPDTKSSASADKTSSASADTESSASADRSA